MSWAITLSARPQHRAFVLFVMGTFVASILPAIMMLWPYASFKDAPYTLISDQRRMTHQLIIAAKKQVVLNPQNPALLEQLTHQLRESHRYLEAAQLFSLVEKYRPLNDQERLFAATCLLDASPGIIPPKAKIWLNGISASSAFYPQVMKLKEQLAIF